jgi:hypothetical protein
MERGLFQKLLDAARIQQAVAQFFQFLPRTARQPLLASSNFSATSQSCIDQPVSCWESGEAVCSNSESLRLRSVKRFYVPQYTNGLVVSL